MCFSGFTCGADLNLQVKHLKAIGAGEHTKAHARTLMGHLSGFWCEMPATER